VCSDEEVVNDPNVMLPLSDEPSIEVSNSNLLGLTHSFMIQSFNKVYDRSCSRLLGNYITGSTT